MHIERIYSLPTGFDALVSESKINGFHFLERLSSDFEQERNVFDALGEALFAAFIGEKLVGIGGVNLDPLNDACHIGRVRRLYVSKHVRGVGVGKALMSEIESHAAGYFDELQLFTDTKEAAAFYQSLGYQPAHQDRVSHHKKLST